MHANGRSGPGSTAYPASAPDIAEKGESCTLPSTSCGAPYWKMAAGVLQHGRPCGSKRSSVSWRAKQRRRRRRKRRRKRRKTEEKNHCSALPDARNRVQETAVSVSQVEPYAIRAHKKSFKTWAVQTCAMKHSRRAVWRKADPRTSRHAG
eukprot:1080311-Rhodomonas_salina.1